MDRKCVVIGLDGCTFAKLNPLINKGILPNIEALIRSGASGNLLSSIPPMTAPSWVSIGTGKNPGKTGIFDFWTPIEGSYKYRIINSNDVKSDYFWETAAKLGKRVVVMNYPVTYPPRDFGGIVVSGMLTPSVDSGFTIPESLKGELQNSKIDYRIDAGWSLDATKDRERFLDDILYCMHERKKAALHLMDKDDWDLFVVVFTALDRVQHFFWHDQDPGHPKYRPEGSKKYSGAVEKVYREMDSIIGEFLYRINRFWPLFIVSDHGFSSLHKLVYVNKILMDEGLLSIKNEFKKIIPKDVNDNVDPEDLTHPVVNHEIIDWENTLCFMPAETCQGLRLNIEGREPEGIIPKSDTSNRIEEIIKILRNVKSKDLKIPIFSNILRRDDVYHGDYKELAPDIIFLNDEIKGLPLTSLTSACATRPTSWRTGHHTPEGVFIAAGRDVRSNYHVEYIDVKDIAPTVLYCLGLPLPSNMDGSVQFDALSADFVSDNPVRILDCEIGYKDTNRPEDIYSEDEKSILRDRLKGLGYL